MIVMQLGFIKSFSKSNNLFWNFKTFCEVNAKNREFAIPG